VLPGIGVAKYLTKGKSIVNGARVVGKWSIALGSKSVNKAKSITSKIKWKGSARGEVVFGKDVRVAPFGHGGVKQAYRQLPHYHRRGPGGIGNHRPWQGFKSNSPYKWWQRF
jgi:hypothetical protein